MEVIVFDSESAARAIEAALVAEGHEVHIVSRDTTDLWGDLVVLDVATWTEPEVLRLAKRVPNAELLFLVDSLDESLPIEEGIALMKPLDVPKLTRLVRVLTEARSGESDPSELVSFEVLFAGDSPAIIDLLRQVRLVAQSDHPVSIYGELGSGRTVVARAIHDRCMRQGRPFMAVNASALPGDQLDQHLFGGPDPQILRVDGGTLFIEFVTDLAPGLQAKLLRLIEQRQVSIEGRDRHIDVRVMVGDDRARLNAGGPLRPSLFYRLKVHELDLPPLRERARDLKAIMGRMLNRLNDGRRSPISSSAARALDGYTFPGNVRELAHALTHAVVLSQGRQIEVEHLPVDIQRQTDGESDDSADLAALETLDAVAKRFERSYLLRVLRAVGGNRTRAAKVLDLSRKGLWQKLKAHGIPAAEGREEADEESDFG
ncbi:MAG: sigma-54-dependent Fis family transcriptional regulator [Deltaproteobacteria bacterium]|nr:sigma-54-dependent Fis family transcriptional regulator [Deltaproteobacteria bacterium]